MKQIKHFTDALAQVLFQKQRGNQQEAQKIIQQSLEKLTKGRHKNFNELSLKQTIALFKNEGKFNSELAFVVADLLIEKGDLDQNKSKKHYMQAYLLYQKAVKDLHSPLPIQAAQKIDRLKENLTVSKINEVNMLME